MNSNLKYHRKCGWKCFGEGTGDYTPVSFNVQKENTILSKAVKKLKEYLKREKIIHSIIKLHGGAYQRSGLPDLLIVLPRGITLWIEFKRPGADTTALQKYNLEQLDKMGHYVGTCDSANLLLEMVKEVIEKSLAKR